MQNTSQLFLTPLLSGGIAGLTVDLTLYPIDTLKTRLQSKHGFIASGGFSGVYRGIGAVVVGSVPSAALFFLSYEAIKSFPGPNMDKAYQPLVHVLAASVAEVMACLVRVPMEIVKQRKQALPGLAGTRNGFGILLDAYLTEGIRKGLYRGFLSTIARDLPFSFIQFPLWEYLKTTVARHSQLETATSIQSAVCGSIAGAIAGGITTPLDVAKTRIMLAPASTKSLGIRRTLLSVYWEKGVVGLFAGFIPRVTGFALGGAIFLGAYDYATTFCKEFFGER